MDNISWNAESSEYQLRSSTETPFHTMQGLHRPKQQTKKCDLCPYEAKYDCALRLYKDRLHKTLRIRLDLKCDSLGVISIISQLVKIWQ